MQNMSTVPGVLEIAHHCKQVPDNAQIRLPLLLHLLRKNFKRLVGIGENFIALTDIT